MVPLFVIGCVLALAITESTAEVRTAIVQLHLTANGPNVAGTIRFIQEGEGGEVRIVGNVTGLNDGDHGFHVHEKGDISGNCVGAGGHFNPGKKHHGAPTAAERHVGDLGNIKAVGTVALVNFTDSVISLHGANNIIGRSIVVHELHDDLGLLNTTDSKTTGSAGKRLACGVIGIESPVSPWEEKGTASSIRKSTTLLLCAVVFAVLKYNLM